MRSQNHTQLSEITGKYASGREAAREILLLCTTGNLAPGRKERISGLLSGKVDWKYLLYLAEYHAITPLVSHNLTVNGFNNQIPKSYLERLNKIYNETLYRNMVLSAELSKVLATFSRNGIPVMTIKGIVLAEMLYENLSLRYMADMDILVRPDNLKQARSLVVEMGYTHLTIRDSRKHPFHGAPFCKQTAFPVFIELHWDLEDTELMSIPMEKLWSRAQTLQLQWGKAMTLSSEDTLMFSIIQLCKQFDQLKVLGDIAEMLKKYEGVLDWDYIIDSANSWGIGTGVYYSLKRAQDLLKAPVPASVMKRVKPKAWRRYMINFLASPAVFFSPIKWHKLRMETSSLVRSLMMKHIRQTLLVLENYRGAGTKGIWLRTVSWTITVFITTLGIDITRVISARNR